MEESNQAHDTMHYCYGNSKNTTLLKHFPLGLDTELVIELVRPRKEERSTLVQSSVFKVLLCTWLSRCPLKVAWFLMLRGPRIICI